MRSIDSYISFVGELENPSVQIVDSGKKRADRPNADVLKAMKAATYLMLYNAVESTIRNAFSEVYQAIGAESITCEDAAKQIRSLWIRQRHLAIDGFSASPSTYRDHAMQIVEDAIDKVSIDLDPDRLPVSGNLDAEQIRVICGLHGVSTKTSRHANGGHYLSDVRRFRNQLAHGELSFVECGRQTTSATLVLIARQVRIFLGGIIGNIGEYIAYKEYAR